MDKCYKKHESYGVVQLSRSQRPATALFGSSIKHENVIKLKIARAELQRKYNLDYVFSSPEHAIVEVEMSYAQFAEAITSLNQGSGVPVTIRYVNGKAVPDCPFESKATQFHAEFEADLSKLSEVAKTATKRAKELLDSKKPLNKAEKEELLSLMASVSRAVDSDIPFVRDRFTEQMEKTLQEAKGNFEGFVQNRMTQVANAAIAQNLKELPSSTDTAGILDIE